jgi:serine protease inhibitor
MQKTEKRMLFGETQTAQMVMLPYGEAKRVGAYVVLPKTPGKPGLTKAVEELFVADASWDQAVDMLGFRPVKLFLPRFKLEYGVKSLKAALGEMGMTDAFQVGPIVLLHSPHSCMPTTSPCRKHAPCLYPWLTVFVRACSRMDNLVG